MFTRNLADGIPILMPIVLEGLERGLNSQIAPRYVIETLINAAGEQRVSLVSQLTLLPIHSIVTLINADRS